MADTLLKVDNINVYYGNIHAVKDISFEVDQGEIVGIVGESGSGKSQSMYSVMGLLSENGTVEDGSILFDGQEISPARFEGTAAAHEKLMESIRGNSMAMIFQDPMSFLNPVLTIEKQLVEPLRNHKKMSAAELHQKAVELLTQVGIPSPEERLKQYPHQLSGGMRQRVMIAMALACKPKLLIADEPTTALDVTIQAQILKLMNDLKEEHGTSIIFITHDLGVIRQIADDVAVMYCGQVVEMAPAGTIFMGAEFSHPYTEGLMNSIPRLSTPTHTRLDAIPGAVPHPLKLPKGCKFAPRCKYATERCLNEEPEMIHVSETQQVRCFYPRKEDRHGKK